MGFNIVLVGYQGSRAAERFLALSDSMPWNIILCETIVEPDSSESCVHFFGKHRPSMVVCFGSKINRGSSGSGEGEGGENEPGGDQSSLRILNQLLPYCSQAAVPVILISSYLALEGFNAREEHLDTTLVPRASQSADESNEFAQVERLVSELDKHIILRASWIIDDLEPCLFSQFLPRIQLDSDYTVSDVHFGRPVASSFIGEVLVAVIQQVLTGAENWGLYHIQSSDKCSEAEFCDQLIRHARKITGKTLFEPAVATADSFEHFLSGAANLSGRRLTDDFGVQLISWRKGFNALLQQWLEQSGHVNGASS